MKSDISNPMAAMPASIPSLEYQVVADALAIPNSGQASNRALAAKIRRVFRSDGTRIDQGVPRGGVAGGGAMKITNKPARS